MLQTRRRKILEILEKKEFVKVTELSKLLNCSEVTIRNDIKILDQKGLLLKAHGGAIRAEQNPVLFNSEKIHRKEDEKIAICREAYELINDGDTIIIDDSTTSFYLTSSIRENRLKKMTVVTNSLLVATELLNEKHINLFLIGGQVSSEMAATMGETAMDNIKGYHVDKAFIGVHGISLKVGITSIGTIQMQVKKAIVGAAKEVIVLADSSKFGGSYLTVICPIERISRVITDNDISEENIKEAKDRNVKLTVCTY